MNISMHNVINMRGFAETCWMDCLSEIYRWAIVDDNIPEIRDAIAGDPEYIVERIKDDSGESHTVIWRSEYITPFFIGLGEDCNLFYAPYWR